MMTTPEYQQMLQARKIYDRATNQPGYLGPVPAELLKLISEGEDAYWDATRGVYVINSDCGGTTGPTPCQVLVSAKQLKAAYTAADVVGESALVKARLIWRRFESYL